MNSSKADVVARVILGLLIVSVLALLSTYSFGFAMMTLPLLLSGVFIIFIIGFPFFLIVSALKKKQQGIEPEKKGKPVHYNEGDRVVLYRSDEESASTKV